MTVAKFYRVNGSSTQLRGVVPDLDLPTAFKINEYGEGSQPSALPWDQIASSRYEVSNQISDKTITVLRDKYNQRLKTDAELKKLVEDLATFQKAREDKTVSLQIDKRRKERAEADKKRAALSSLDDEEDEDVAATATPVKKKTDIYLNETARILADLVSYTNEPNLAGTKKKK
jgi:carboxyl-terminal processing protease